MSRASGMEWLVLAALVWALGGCAASPPLPPVAEETNSALEVEHRRQPQRRPEAYAQMRVEAIRSAIEIDETTREARFAGQTAYVILSSFRFDPDLVTLRSGTLTRVRLGNNSLVTHYFGGEGFFDVGAEIVNLFGSTLPLNQHHIPVGPGEIVDLYLFVKDPGEYRLDCFVPTHRDQGMVGAILVEPPLESPPHSG